MDWTPGQCTSDEDGSVYLDDDLQMTAPFRGFQMEANGGNMKQKRSYNGTDILPPNKSSKTEIGNGSLNTKNCNNRNVMPSKESMKRKISGEANETASNAGTGSTSESSPRETISFGRFDVGPFKVCLKAPRIVNPDNRYSVKAVDAEIPTSVSEEDLLLEFKNSNPNLPVKEIYRLKRKVVDPVSGAASFVDSESVKVTIRSSTIPQFVFLWKIRVSTSIVIPRLRVCHNCGQLNHPTKFCRNAAKCLNCGEAKHPESVTCVKPAVCISCSCNHRTFSKDCKEYFKRREINRVMAVDNVDFRTARLTLEDNLKNVLNDAGRRQNMNPKEFPPLQYPLYSSQSYAQSLSRNGTSVTPATATRIPHFADKLVVEDLKIWKNIETALSSSNDISPLLRRLLKASVRKKLVELSLRSKDYSVILLAETWCRLQDPLKIKGFDTVRCDRFDQRGGGVAILVSNAVRLHSVKTDWKEVSRLLEEATPLCLGLVYNADLDIQTKYSSFFALISDCVTSATPNRNTKKGSKPRNNVDQNHKGRKSTAWWNPECEEMVGFRKAAFRKFKSKLKVLGFPKNTLNFIYNLIHFRTVHIRFDSVDEIRHVFKGLPQGCVLSPLLYMLYVQNLEALARGLSSVQVLEFADDICLFVSHRVPDTTVRILEERANVLVGWLNSLNLMLSHNKTIFCVFSNSSSIVNRRWSLCLESNRLYSQQKVRFLGINFQLDLKWNNHVEAVSRSCIKPLGVLNLLRGVWWGADPSILLAIYKALIRSRLEYGAFIWNELPAYLGKKVDRIQYKAVRLALGYRRSCPINVILGESKELPLELRLEFLGRNFLAKVFGNYDHPLLPVLTSYADLTETPTFIPKRPPPLLVLLHKDIVPISYLIVSDNKPCYSSFKFETLLVEPDVSFSEASLDILLTAPSTQPSLSWVTVSLL
ncbi:hypothetical protein DMN91_011531 [Ooceraea biroi]|uniref:Reverse transcriptase domain-containing protein n=1 Tax=Ooceraea biroi TaxID=2015173 RepID=A0A3L8D5P7_OOCBI|nr:hypothetical protein DMN91_011531 [Ooceraea biroi]